MTKRARRWLSPILVRAVTAGSLWAGASVLSYPSDLRGQTIQGSLTDARTGFAMSGANVALRDSTGNVVSRTASNDLGAFQFLAPKPGRYSLQVDAIGYGSTESEPFEVGERGVTTIDLSLRPQPVEVDSIVVVGEARRTIPYLERQGFYKRLDEGAGYFITPEEIERRNPRSFTDMLRSVPGLQVRTDGKVNRWGARCFRVTPRLWVDGILVAEGIIELSHHVSVDEVEAIEVYQGPAAIPLQYGGTGGQCAMLIWTKGGIELLSGMGNVPFQVPRIVGFMSSLTLSHSVGRFLRGHPF